MPRNKTGHFYYEWYPTIYQADTQSLTLAEDGAYRRLLDHYMLTRAPLIDDDRALSRIIGIGLEEWESIKIRVKIYFKPSVNPVGYLHHAFCDQTLKIHEARIGKSRANGIKGGRPKSLNNKDNNPAGYETITQQKPITEQNRIEKKVSKEESKIDSPSKKGEVGLNELSVDHVKDWLAEKRMQGRYLLHDEYFILEQFKNYCQSKGKHYADFIAGYRNAFEWERCQPKQQNDFGAKPTKDERARAAVMQAVASFDDSESR